MGPLRCQMARACHISGRTVQEHREALRELLAPQRLLHQGPEVHLDGCGGILAAFQQPVRHHVAKVRTQAGAVDEVVQCDSRVVRDD